MMSIPALCNRTAWRAAQLLKSSAKIKIKSDVLMGFYRAACATLFTLLFAPSVQAQGLAKGATILQSVQSDVYSIVTVLAVIILIILAICYAAKWCTMETFMRWGVGCIVAGCASQIANMFFN